MRKFEQIGLRAKLHRAAEEPLELAHIGVAAMAESDGRRADVSACDHTQRRLDAPQDEFDIMPRGIPWKAGKLDLSGCAARRWGQFQAGRFVHDPAVSGVERQSLADVASC